MHRSILLALISAFLFILPGFSAQARVSCSQTHLEATTTLREWPEVQARYSESLNHLSKSDQRDRKIIYEAAFFFDLKHIQVLLTEAMKKDKKINVAQLIRTYGDRTLLFTDKFEGPFANFVKTNDWLASERPEITVDTFKEINRRMLEGRVLLRLTDQQKGNFREISTAGNLRAGGGILTEAKAQNYRENIYLNYAGKDLVYATVRENNPVHLEIIRKQDPALALEIEAYHRPNFDYKGSTYEQLESRAMHALVSERFARFNFERRRLGTINPRNSEQYVDLVAEFQRDLVSIHPFWDGNGRSTRILMNYLLTKENLPPARILDPDLDLNASLRDWQAAVKKGMKQTLKLTENFALRNDLGLPLHRSKDLVQPE